MIARRRLLIALSLAPLTAALTALAQHPAKIPRIGFIAARARPDSLDTDPYGGFVLGLRELGYVDGKNIAIEWRFADGKYENLPGLMAGLLQLKIDVILAAAGPAALEAKRATTTIPIVMGGVGDPIGLGLVTSLSRPGGNITGVTNIAADVSGKNLELLHAIVPKLSQVAVMINPVSAITLIVLKQIRAAAPALGLKISVFEAGNPNQIDAALGAVVRARPGALIVTPDPLFFGQSRQIAGFALSNRLPSMGFFREHAEAGGLMSYGQYLVENFRRAAAYVDKILKGAKPCDLPIEQPTRLELVINRKTAKTLGLAIPQELLLRADHVIE